jgi:hypothetical protein
MEEWWQKDENDAANPERGAAVVEIEIGDKQLVVPC